MGKTDIAAKIFEENTITVDMFGYAFYRGFKYKMVTHARVFSLKAKFELTESSGIFIVSTFHFLNSKFGYENMCSWSKIKDEYIELPTKNGKIDFEFMESFVAELEAQRVAELEDYLLATGLKDYELTDEEKETIDYYDNIQLTEYRLGDLFEIKPTKAYKQTNDQLFDDYGTTPVVTNSSVNNGVSGYSKMLATERGNIITYSDTTTSDGIFYQPYDFIGYSHIQGLYPKLYNEKWNYKTLIFIVGLFKKVATGRFSYGNKFNRAIAREFLIKLPTKNGEIDFEFMENLISALQKMVIKEVVFYADRKIEATREV